MLPLDVVLKSQQLRKGIQRPRGSIIIIAAVKISSSIYIMVLEENEEENCVICMEPCKSSASIDGCHHTFCRVCISDWAKVTNLCPVCRKEFQRIRSKDKTRRSVGVARKRQQVRYEDTGMALVDPFLRDELEAAPEDQRLRRQAVGRGVFNNFEFFMNEDEERERGEGYRRQSLQDRLLAAVYGHINRRTTTTSSSRRRRALQPLTLLSSSGLLQTRRRRRRRIDRPPSREVLPPRAVQSDNFVIELSDSDLEETSTSRVSRRPRIINLIEDDDDEDKNDHHVEVIDLISSSSSSSETSTVVNIPSAPTFSLEYAIQDSP